MSIPSKNTGSNEIANADDDKIPKLVLAIRARTIPLEHSDQQQRASFGHENKSNKMHRLSTMEFITLHERQREYSCHVIAYCEEPRNELRNAMFSIN